MNARADVFDTARSRLTGRAYRLLGTFADADDVVQDAWLRWNAADQTAIERPEAWLNTVVTRLAIDRLRQRKRDEARYVGPWLPVPVVQRHTDPADVVELADSMTTAFLVMLEALSPDERAAFLLADVFGEPFDSIASSMDRTVESCRQLASRARRKVRGADQVRRDELGASDDVVRRFLHALATGDEAGAVDCLAPDAVYVSDGGADRRAARRPVREPERIVRLLLNLWRRWPDSWEIVPAVVGGYPGVVVESHHGMQSVTGFQVVDGRIVHVDSILNPDKLADVGRHPSGVE